MAYLEGETVFFTIFYNDAFSKAPIFPNSNNTQAINISWDLYDEGAVNLIGSGAFTETPMGPSVGFQALLQIQDRPLDSGVYTLRVYGDNVAPSFKQIRVLGFDDYENDFQLNLNLVS